jgi:hypothetical protein
MKRRWLQALPDRLEREQIADAESNRLDGESRIAKQETSK